MQLILKFVAGLSEHNETSVEFNGEFAEVIAKLKNKNSDIHQWVNDELNEVQILKSHIELALDDNKIFSKVFYTLDKEPNQEELDIIAEETSGQLTDGYGSEPWEIKTSNGNVLISLINFSKSEYLKPNDIKMFPEKTSFGIFSKIKSILPKKNCSRKIENAVESGKFESVKDYVENGGNINCIGKWGQTLLMKAIQNNHENISLYIIENGADIKKVDDKNGTALFKTGFYGLSTVAKRLIEEGALINKKCGDGMTPLMMASNRNQLDLVKLLVEKGAEINIFNDHGYSALTTTTNPEVFKFLLSKGADPELINFRGANALDVIKSNLEVFTTSEINDKYKKIIEILKGKY